MDLSSATTMHCSVPRSTLYWTLPCASLVTLTVFISLINDSSPLSPTRFLQYSNSQYSNDSQSSSSNSGSGGIPVPMVIGFVCNAVKRWLCEGWPSTTNARLFWVLVYVMVNVVTFGVGGMVWLALYFLRRFGLCRTYVGTVGKGISYTGTQVKAYMRVVQIMDAAILKRLTVV